MTLADYVKTAARLVTRYAPLARALADSMPRPGEGPLRGAMRLADSAGKAAGAFGLTDDAQGVAAHLRGLGLEPTGNGEALVALFCETPLRASLDERSYHLTEDFAVVCLRHPTAGAMYFVEYRGGSTGPQLWGDVWAPPGFDFAAAADAAWAGFGGRASLSFVWSPQTHATRPVFPPMPPPGALAGEGAERLDRFVARQAKFVAAGVARWHLLLGPAGTGKSTFADHAAGRLGGRVLRVDGEALTGETSYQLGPALRAMRPNALVLDDLDRSADLAKAMPRLLTAVTDLQAERPDLTVYVTANAIERLAPVGPGGEVDDALVSRIHEIHDFARPDASARARVLASYLEGLPDRPDGDDLARVVAATDGLTERYVRDAAVALRHDSVDDVVAMILRRRAVPVGEHRRDGRGRCERCGDEPAPVAPCSLPPPGWSCSRAGGHAGPCSASPSEPASGSWGETIRRVEARRRPPPAGWAGWEPHDGRDGAYWLELPGPAADPGGGDLIDVAPAVRYLALSVEPVVLLEIDGTCVVNDADASTRQHLTPAQARAMARALETAADEAERRAARATPTGGTGLAR